MDSLHFTFDVTITQGDDRDLNFYFETDVPAAINVSTWDFWYTAKKSPDTEALDNGAAISILPSAVDKTAAASGSIVITLPAAKTSLLTPGTYVHDLQVVRSGSVATFGKGKLVVEPQVTNRTVE